MALYKQTRWQVGCERVGRQLGRRGSRSVSGCLLKGGIEHKGYKTPISSRPVSHSWPSLIDSSEILDFSLKLSSG